MNIDLLSKMVRELILDNDEVCLPGLGSFVAERVGASFADRGYTIQPPYRKLSFRQREENGNLLIDFYAQTNGIGREDAARILTSFLGELREILEERKVVVFPGMGRLRATRENHFFFVSDEDLDIDPDGIALEAVSLKTHVETADEVATAVADLRMMVPEPAPEPESAPEPETGELVPEPEPVVEEPELVPAPAETAPEPAPVPEEPVPAAPEKEGKTSVWQWILYVLSGAVILCAVGLVAFLVLVHVAPEFTDRLLYSPEQLEIMQRWQEVFGK